MPAGSVSSALKGRSRSILVVRLRWQKRSPSCKEQSNNEYPSPAHLVVPKGPNVNVIDNEIQRHTQ